MENEQREFGMKKSQNRVYGLSKKKRGYFAAVVFAAAAGGLRSVAGVV
jgi:hypothetical protein